MFNVDFKKFVVWITPIWLRRGYMMIVIYACTWPLRQLYNLFLLFVTQKLYRLSHNSQVYSLRAVLNDAFDFTLRRITITDFNGIYRIYFWPEIDRLDVDFSVTQYFWPESAYQDSGTDFTVHLPIGIVLSTDLLIALLEEYKLAGKKYNIVYE